MKEAREKKVHISFSLYKVLEEAKLICGQKRKIKTVVDTGMEEGARIKEKFLKKTLG